MGGEAKGRGERVMGGRYKMKRVALFNHTFMPHNNSKSGWELRGWIG